MEEPGNRVFRFRERKPPGWRFAFSHESAAAEVTAIEIEE
jgi:hypothetical protein